MNEAPWIAVNRFPYEEPYHTHLDIQASNGAYAGAIDFYCGVDEIREIGEALSTFPSHVPDEYRFSVGSDEAKDRWAYHFVLRAYTWDAVGHCALQFVMNLNRTEPYEGLCSFSIPAEPAQIARLGRLFVRLHERPSTSFRWTLDDEEFIEGRHDA
jgi:hypothetical protein